MGQQKSVSSNEGLATQASSLSSVPPRGALPQQFSTRQNAYDIQVRKFSWDGTRIGVTEEDWWI